MLTPNEIRILYLLKKHGGQVQHKLITNAMQRVYATDRYRAIKSLQDLELIESTVVPRGSLGGVSGMVYWLTAPGLVVCADLIEQGEMKDPAPAVPVPSSQE